jgi:thiamine biosynthesis lipoprotein
MSQQTPVRDDLDQHDSDKQDIEIRFPAMASSVTVKVLRPGRDAADAVARVQALFGEVERACTRFNVDSDLMRANRSGRGWCTVSPICVDVIAQALDAHRLTDGVFDPRILNSLQALGYDRSWELMDSQHVSDSTQPTPVGRRRWRPGIDRSRNRVRIGAQPIDLGGVGKGYAVRESLTLLRGHGSSALIEAGGDVATFGPGPRSGEWSIAVENPAGGPDPVAVLKLSDTAVATSSIQRRRWRRGDQTVHHLIDPSTGRPGGVGLLSVTVVHPDAVTAEVESKVGFLLGQTDIRAMMNARSVAAVWVGEDGRVGYSNPATSMLEWKTSRASVC